MAGLYTYGADDEIIELPDDFDPHFYDSSSSDIVLLDGPHPGHTVNVNADQPGPSRQIVNSFEECLPRILEIVPDADHDHLKKLWSQHEKLESGEECIQLVLHALLEDPSYPRSSKTLGKRKRNSDTNDGNSTSKLKLDLSSADRPVPSGPNYFPLALQQLQLDYPYIPKQHIRNVLANHRGLYAPSHLFLDKESKDERLPYRLKTTAFRLSGKDKVLHDPDFQVEREWLVKYLESEGQSTTDTKPTGEEDEEDEDPECEDGIDCACCFSKYAFDRMIQCPEAHLFCRMCCRRYAANQLGQHDHRLICMDQSGCKQPFPESELTRFLSPKLLKLYHRVKQQKEIADASLEGLEECPFCEYKVVIDNPDERLFRCEAEDCMAITCRQCKKPDHLPKSCKEAESDAVLDVRHTLEEAMTRAMMRNCPKCQKSFIKELGCNKITCTHCGTMSCYVCRQIIRGYDHFDRGPPNGNSGKSSSTSKCLLSDPIELRHDLEVREAAETLKKQLKEENPDLPDEALNVDIPKVNARNGWRPGQQHMVIPQGIQYHYPVNLGIPMDMHDPHRQLGQGYLAGVQAQVPQQPGALQLQGQAAYVGWQRPPDLQPPPVPYAPLPRPEGRRRRRR